MRWLLQLLPFTVVALAVALVAVWLWERRKREVFPASQAKVLLNPLRGMIMPVGKTLERFGLAEGEAVLELGPGPGYYSVEASRMLGPNGRLLCLDLQPGMLQVLRDRLSEAGMGANVDLVVADATRLPIREGVVDAAFLVTVLGEIPDQAAALAELGRVLKAQGRLGFSETLGDADIVFPGTLRRRCRAARFSEAGYWRNWFGYTMLFSKAGAP